MRKRFKIGDKIRVLPYSGFSEKGNKLIGLEGVVIHNPGNGFYGVALYVDDVKVTATLETKNLERAE